MSSRTGIQELREGYRQLGPVKFFATIVCLLAWAGLGVWLIETATWPGQCDHSGRKLIGYLKELYCSSALFTGGWREWALFAWLWALPAFIPGLLIYLFITKRGIFKKPESE